MVAKWILHFSKILIVFGTVEVAAQNIIEDDNLTLTADLGLKSNLLNTELQQRSQQATNLIYQPNVGPQSFVSVSYGHLSASLNMTSGSAENPVQTHGESKAQDYQLRLFGQRWTPEFFYQSYQGYYLNNTEASGVSPQNGYGKYLRPDMRARHWGGQIFYNFSPEDYSFSGHFSLRSKQIASGGSWFMVGSLSQYSLLADSPIVPTGVSSYGMLGNATAIEVTSLSFGGAGAYNFIYEDYFLGGLLGFGVNYQDTHTRGVDMSFSQREISGIKTYVKAAAGYNGDKFLSGLSINVDGQSVEFDQAKVLLDTIEIKLFFGWRFGDPKLGWLKDINNRVANVVDNN
jgi:hypothetical protein